MHATLSALAALLIASGAPARPPIDYDGDGRSDIAVFRPSTGLWAVYSLTRANCGTWGDRAVPGDYNGDGTSDIAIFRPSTGLWRVPAAGQAYLGEAGDVPCPGDYDGDGTEDAAVFRPSAALWAISRLGRIHFGSPDDRAAPADYDGDGTSEIAVYRPARGLWAVRSLTRVHFGIPEDCPIAGDFRGDGTAEFAIFRPAGGLWSIRGFTRRCFGSHDDLPQAGIWGEGAAVVPAVFREAGGFWALAEITRTCFGVPGDQPAAARLYDQPTPPPTTPTPPPFGTVVAVFPSAVAGSLGSIDFRDGDFWEYCRGTAKLYRRRMSDGGMMGELELDPRLTQLWAVAWDSGRGCWWATNPECENVDFNLIRLDAGGGIREGQKLMGGHSSNWIRFYDCDLNEDYRYSDDSGTIEIGDIFTGDVHFSLNKWDYIDPAGDDWYERFWFKSDILHRAVTRTGATYWAAESSGTRIIEYRQAERRQIAERTGRAIDAGIAASSLKFDGTCLWAKGDRGIYRISLGVVAAPTPAAAESPFSVILPDRDVESVAADGSGNVYATGTTGDGLVYVAKFGPSGEEIATRYLGAGHGQAIAVDPAGNVIIGGGVGDDDWPVVNAFQDHYTPGSLSNGYLTKFDPTLQTIVFSTYLGGGLQHADDAPDGDSIHTVRTDSAGNIYWLGSGQNNDWRLGENGLCIIGYRPPCPGCYTVYSRDHTWGYGGYSKWSNVVIGKFSPAGSLLQMVNPGGGGPDTSSGAFAVSPAGDVYYGARTKSTQAGIDPWPSTAGSFRDEPYDGGQSWFDGAAGRLNRSLGDLAWASFVGGHAQNNPFGGAVANDALVVVGYTKASDYPAVWAIQGAFGGDHDAFVTRFDPAGSALLWSTFLGGSGYDLAAAGAFDSQGRCWVAGLGQAGFPLTEGSLPDSGTGSFVARISADGRRLEHSTARHGGQAAADVAVTNGYYVVGIVDGDDARLVKARQ